MPVDHVGCVLLMVPLFPPTQEIRREGERDTRLPCKQQQHQRRRQLSWPGKRANDFSMAVLHPSARSNPKPGDGVSVHVQPTEPTVAHSRMWQMGWIGSKTNTWQYLPGVRPQRHPSGIYTHTPLFTSFRRLFMKQWALAMERVRSSKRFELPGGSATGTAHVDDVTGRVLFGSILHLEGDWKTVRHAPVPFSFYKP